MESDLATASDAELVARLRAGDHLAFGVLYDRYARAVYSLALSIVRDPAAAEDVTQELFLQLWRYPDLYQPERGPFGSWFLRAARNRAVDVLRRRKRHWQLEKSALGLVTLASSEDDPDDIVSLDDAAGRVRRALAQLEPELRQVVELTYFGGLTQREIAEQLGIPLGTVKSRVRSALRRLAEALTGDREAWTH